MKKIPAGPSSLYTAMVSNFFFPLQERLKKHNTVSVRKEMEQTEWWDENRLHEHRLNQLKNFLANVQENVPYYNRLFNELGFNGTDIRSLDELEKIPLLDKQAIRENSEAMKSKLAQHLTKVNTSGSTGEPLSFFLGRERVSHDVAAKWRATRWWDVDIGDTEIVLWGSHIELGAQDYIRKLRDSVLRSTLLPTRELSSQTLEKYLAEIKKIRPKMLFGYPSSMFFLAQYAHSKGWNMCDLGIKVAFVTAERIYSEQRKLISEVFGCPVANGYGGRDAGFIAHECPDGGMHITAEDIIVEIVGPDGAVLPPGEVGEIVVTHMFTQDFPFIRYRTGDLGVLDSDKCTCGRGLPLIKKIEGRNNDFLVALDGTLMHEVDFTSVLRNQPQITSFKVIQESLECLDIYIVSHAALDNALLQKIEKTFKNGLGDAVNVNIKQVAEIQSERSGKFRYVVSKVTGNL